MALAKDLTSKSYVPKIRVKLKVSSYTVLFEFNSNNHKLLFNLFILVKNSFRNPLLHSAVLRCSCARCFNFLLVKPTYLVIGISITLTGKLIHHLGQERLGGSVLIDEIFFDLWGSENYFEIVQHTFKKCHDLFPKLQRRSLNKLYFTRNSPSWLRFGLLL